MSFSAKLLMSNLTLLVFMVWALCANKNKHSATYKFLDKLGGILLLLVTPALILYWLWS
jgi:hypothetical protein